MLNDAAKDSVVLPTLQEGDDDISLRPTLLKHFVGQQQLCDNLHIFAQAAKQKNIALDHVLLYGPPGLGKTTLAQIVSKEMGVNFKATSGPIIAKAGDLAAILTNLEERDVLFIDEIHRLNTNVEETLYSAMEDFVLDIIIGEGPAARTVRIDLPRFTLIGATTRMGLISNPLRDRFGIPLRLQFYNHEELGAIIQRASKLLHIVIDASGVAEIAKRSRGTPRIALRLLRRIADFALVNNNQVIDAGLANEILLKLEVDALGLDGNDRRYLNVIAKLYAGGPVGINTIAAALSEKADTIEEIIEPFLIQQGLIQKTSRGRVITARAEKHICCDF